ncbi:uncharacterized protein Dyak_GE12686 [Drosophila yakuba]|uniref:DUF753 domain-containing protein n=1 Tax=Drosophila yakuba TaxID=7245 RepID=B4PAE2_DROYA|nr:uncharacterized protein Dyak_GE12686 [Drosophila yakuba]
MHGLKMNPHSSFQRVLLLLLILLKSRSFAIVCYHCDSIALPECSQTLGEVGVLPYKECPTELTCAMSIGKVKFLIRGVACKALLLRNAASVAMATGSTLFQLLYIRLEAYRGHVSEQNHTLSNAAKMCDINSCNEDQGAWIQVCATCDSANSRGCKIDLFQVNTGRCNVSLYEECQQDVLLGEQEDKYCFSFQRLSRVVRGCSTKMPSDLEPYVEQLEKCRSGGHCNAGCIAQQKCFTCNSADQELCRTNITSIANSTCSSAEASSCFSCEYSNWSIQRGCGAPPTNPQITKCYECDDGAGCNRKDFTRCYQCSTEQAGAGCANWERPGEIYIEECAEPGAPCVVVSYNNGTTARGCQKSDFSCTSANVASCRPCEGSFCNKGPFPEERLWCHQCRGVQDCEEISRGQTALPCPLRGNEPEHQELACLEFFDINSKEIVRGCRSNSQLYYECLLKSNHLDSCRTCHSQACNNSPGQDLRAAYDLETKALSLLQGKSSAISIEIANVCYGIWLLLSASYLSN